MIKRVRKNVGIWRMGSERHVKLWVCLCSAGRQRKYSERESERARERERQRERQRETEREKWRQTEGEHGRGREISGGNYREK